METNLKVLTEEVFRPLTGKPCWNVQHGYAACLTLQFGDPHLEIREPRPPKPDASENFNRWRTRRQIFMKGEWHLWTYACEWSVYRGEELVGRDTTGRKKDQAVAELDGQILTGVEADLAEGIWIFHFDLGGRLITRRYSRRSRYYSDEKELWLFFKPDDWVLTVRADGKYSHQHGETPPSDERWHDPGEPLQWHIDLRE